MLVRKVVVGGGANDWLFCSSLAAADCVQSRLAVLLTVALDLWVCWSPGLHIARERLEGIKAKFPGISYADLYTLAGVVAVEEMGGPKIKWVSGRTDAKVCASVWVCTWCVVTPRCSNPPSFPSPRLPPPPFASSAVPPATHFPLSPHHLVCVCVLSDVSPLPTCTLAVFCTHPVPLCVCVGGRLIPSFLMSVWFWWSVLMLTC